MCFLHLCLDLCLNAENDTDYASVFMIMVTIVIDTFPGCLTLPMFICDYDVLTVMFFVLKLSYSYAFIPMSNKYVCITYSDIKRLFYSCAFIPLSNKYIYYILRYQKVVTL